MSDQPPPCAITRDPATGNVTGVRIETFTQGNTPWESENNLRRLLTGAGASEEESDALVAQYLPLLDRRVTNAAVEKYRRQGGGPVNLTNDEVNAALGKPAQE
jgi:hypothetical protein